MSNSFFNHTNRLVRFDSARAEDLNALLDAVSSGLDGVEVKTNAAIKLPDGETAAALPAAGSRAGKVLSFGASGEPVSTYLITDVATVSGIAADVTTVAGIAANVTAVAGNATNINAVAADASDIGIVAAANTSIGTVATNIASVNTTATNIADVIAAPTHATTATTQAGIATTQAGIATTQAGTATTQSGIATTQAGIATTKAAEAAASAASIAGGPVTSVNGMTGIVTGLVTPSSADTLTNKTIESALLTNGYTETQYSLTGTDLAVSNGTVQYKTLSGNTTFTESLADGQGVILMLNPSTFTTTWFTCTWIGTVASTAPTLIASVYNCLVFFQMNGTLYGRYVGRV